MPISVIDNAGLTESLVEIAAHAQGGQDIVIGIEFHRKTDKIHHVSLVSKNLIFWNDVDNNPIGHYILKKTLKPQYLAVGLHGFGVFKSFP